MSSLWFSFTILQLVLQCFLLCVLLRNLKKYVYPGIFCWNLWCKGFSLRRQILKPFHQMISVSSYFLFLVSVSMIKENRNPHVKTQPFNLKVFNKQERGIVLQKCKYSYYWTLTFSHATSTWSYQYGLTYIAEKCFLYVNLDLPMAFKS